MLRTVGSTFTWGLRMACAIHVVHSYVYELTETFGESMLPVLNYTGDFAHINKLYKRGRGCQVGDVVVAAKPTDPSSGVCKRITGMPGDIIAVDPSADDGEKLIRVPQGHCWLTGENLSQSLDSRSYGVVPLALIQGKVFGVHDSSGGFRWVTNTLEDPSDQGV